MTERLHFDFSLSCIGEGNGNPLQCSRLENPRDGGAWWAAVYGVAQSQTRLKQLSSSSSMVSSGVGQATGLSRRRVDCAFNLQNLTVLPKYRRQRKSLFLEKKNNLSYLLIPVNYSKVRY